MSEIKIIKSLGDCCACGKRHTLTCILFTTGRLCFCKGCESAILESIEQKARELKERRVIL